MNKRPYRVFIAPWTALCFFGLSACASSMAGSKLEDPRGLIDLNARMPAGQSPYGIAYGAPAAARVRPDTPDIDAYLKPEVVNARPPRVMIAKAEPVKPARVEQIAAPAAESLSAETLRATPEQAPLLAIADAPPPATGDDSARYADREAQSQKLEEFRGGDAIVITSGALLIVLLVVILILLLR